MYYINSQDVLAVTKEPCETSTRIPGRLPSGCQQIPRKVFENCTFQLIGRHNESLFSFAAKMIENGFLRICVLGSP